MKIATVFAGPKIQSLMALCIDLTVIVLCSGCLFSGITTPPAELTNPEWHLLSYRSQDGTQTQVLPNTSVSLRFTSDGQFSGMAGCNGYVGSYTIEGELITLESLASTEMYCLEPAGMMDQEVEYLRLLSDTTRYHVADECLVLSYYDVEKMLIFARN